MSDKDFASGCSSTCNSTGNDTIYDYCAFCLSKYDLKVTATHFCSECGCLGHFLCEKCLSYHNHFSEHKNVHSIAAANYKRRCNQTTEAECSVEQRGATKLIHERSATSKGLGLSVSSEQLPADTYEVGGRRVIKTNYYGRKSQQEEETILKEEEEKQKRGERENVRKRKQTLESSLQNKISSLKDQYNDSAMKYSLLKKATMKINTQQNGIDSSESELFVLEKNELMEAKLRTVREEKANLLHRLYKISSARHRQNNPDIADLSDENRPTKLAERLSELYDNEWTDLFEATKNTAGKKTNERKIAEDLRELLKFCYDICQRFANNQLVNIISCLNNMESLKDLQASPPELRLRLKEFQNNISRYSVPHIETAVSKEVFTSIGKERKEENTVVKCSSKMKKQYSPYIKLCTEITWHMQIQDPPLVLDFGAKTTDISRFRPYTASGPLLDYILWPAMLLHDNGPIVAKGVAQFKKYEEQSKNNK